eukprot:CAMPEP_0202769694 /NCGR_PEP_ID=MMETSP1388-20130828/37220_1 /ASSEMBLY_ACC=CAM_ASM_000864 /TAXON_ID=37098 /ORGANISM="Isochrysis sp, Strain CCMP1244" /LENGTH=724 /DNA_ID=CAMNT_0049438489 /DNA_START=88 /DNA_END=2259 /DNA_ORIENTATION=+
MKKARVDVTITDDGNCFVYTSENIFATPLLFSDWRTWKTCGVFDGQTLTNTLVSDPVQEGGTDYSFPQASNDASVVCLFRSRPSPNVPRRDIIMGADGIYTPLTSVDTDRGCDVSYDGSTVVYAEEDSDGVLQTYLYDRQSSTKTKISDAATKRAKWPRTSAHGTRTVFVSQKAATDPTLTSSSSGLKYDEAWIYQRGTGEPEQIANLAGQQCNRTYMYELMVKDHGLAAVAAEFSSPSKLGNGGTPCQYYAAKGVTSGAGTISLGDNGASISGDGRFVVYGANYDLSTIRGTHEAKSTVSARNLFLFDATLGLTWQITKEGNQSQLEDYCCPTASGSVQRGTCSLRNEMKGFCCWQRPCGHPTVDQRISSDGKSIVFWGDGFPDATHVNQDWDIFHYHIPTSTLTTITRTSNKNFDEAYAEISSGGDVVAWTSDYDFASGESITSTNQIFTSRLALGCSNNQDALNYDPSPDVEVCCEFAESSAPPATGRSIVTLELHGDADKMLSAIPFNGSSGFCSNYMAAVRADVACSLGLPPTHVEVTADACASWGREGIEVDVCILSDDAATLSAALVAQVSDPASRIWSGYITKTLRAAHPKTPPVDPLEALQLIITQSPPEPLVSEAVMCAVIIDFSLDFGVTSEVVCTLDFGLTTGRRRLSQAAGLAKGRMLQGAAIVYTVTIVDTFAAAPLAAWINDPANQAGLVLSSELSSKTNSTINIVSVE